MISQLPSAPSRGDSSEDFSAKADAFVAALAIMVSEMNAAISLLNADAWVSGTTYAIGNLVWSPANSAYYRRRTNGAGTTDPSADSTNWAAAFDTNLAGLLNFKVGTPIASAATLNLATAGGNIVHITGTTATSAVTMAPGEVVFCIADGAWQLTYHATNNKISGGRDYILTAGDMVIYSFDGVVVRGQIIKADGTSPVATIPVSTRQTVLSGPVDSSGLPAFGGSTGSTSVTASGTLKVTAMAGGDANYTGSITNPSWMGLSTNGTMFLCLDITSAGVVSTSSMTLAPIQQLGGAYSTANGQMTLNVNEGVAKLGNGTSATQIFRTVVGEVSVAGGVVTSIVWYGMNGRYQSADTAIPATTGTITSFNHNLGLPFGASSLLPPPQISAWVKCYTTDAGYAVGEVIPFIPDLTSNHVGIQSGYLTGRNSAVTITGANTPLIAMIKSSGIVTTLNPANWKQIIVVSRGW